QQALAATQIIAPGTLVNPYTDGSDSGTVIEAYEAGSSSPAGFESAVATLHGAATTSTVPNLGTAFFIDVNIPDNMDGPDEGTAEDPILNGASVNDRIAAYEKIFGDRTLRIFGNQQITSAFLTFTGYSGTANDPDANYTLTWTSTSTRIDIEFAAHLAQGNDFTLAGVGYGAGQGAGSISGGPYHVSLNKQARASLGSQDNQTQANAVSTPPNPSVKIVKLTNGTDNDSPTGPHIKVGDPVTWTYNVTNTGNVPLSNVVVTDSVAGVTPAPALPPGFHPRDSHPDGPLHPTPN